MGIRSSDHGVHRHKEHQLPSNIFIMRSLAFQVILATVTVGLAAAQGDQGQESSGDVYQRRLHNYGRFRQGQRGGQLSDQFGGQLGGQIGGQQPEEGQGEPQDPIQTIIQLVMIQQQLEAQKIQVPTPSAGLVGRLFDVYLGPQEQEQGGEQGGEEGQGPPQQQGD